MWPQQRLQWPGSVGGWSADGPKKGLKDYAPPGSGGTGTSEPVATTKVTMAKSYRFDPKIIEIKAGQTVTWTNEDNFTHTVQVDGQDDDFVGACP